MRGSVFIRNAYEAVLSGFLLPQHETKKFWRRSLLMAEPREERGRWTDCHRVTRDSLGACVCRWCRQMPLHFWPQKFCVLAGGRRVWRVYRPQQDGCSIAGEGGRYEPKTAPQNFKAKPRNEETCELAAEAEPRAGEGHVFSGDDGHAGGGPKGSATTIGSGQWTRSTVLRSGPIRQHRPAAAAPQTTFGL